MSSSTEKGTCPIGGLWYECTAQSPMFFGCCTSDPCNGSGCPLSDLRAAGMGTGSGADSPTNPALISNDGSYYNNNQCPGGPSHWWTCALQTPSFQGCCQNNPCGGSGDSGGCPDGQLLPAAFISPPSGGSIPTSILTSTEVKTPAPTSSSSSSSQGQSTSKSSQTSQSPKATHDVTSEAPSSATKSTKQTSTGLGSAYESSPTPTSTSLTPGAKSRSNVPAIAGGAAGGVAILIVAIIAALYIRRRKRKSHIRYSSSSAATDPKIDPKSHEHWTSSPEPVADHGFDRAGVQPYHDEAYYPGRPIFGVPHATKAHDSPAPPSYSSPQPSPLRDVHEIHSNPIHEADVNQGLAIRTVNHQDSLQYMPTQMGSPPIGRDDFSSRDRGGRAELSGTKSTQRKLVGSKKGAPRPHRRVDSGESYTGWQNF